MGNQERASSKIMRVLFVAAEADPIIKVGGLGDVTGSLPLALRSLEPARASGYELDVRLAIPFHSAITIPSHSLERAASFKVPHPDGPIQAQAFKIQVDTLPVYLIQGAPIPEDAPVYSLDTRKDGEKYTFFSLAVLELARALNWAPDILHANDWHTALSVYQLSLLRPDDPFFARTRSILTVHNLPFMGGGTEDALASFGIAPLRDSRLPPWGTFQPLPLGLASADIITTVSPTYAREILTPEFGSGLQGFLQKRASDIIGILNGLDEDLWNPATDSHLAANFNKDALDERAANKQALVREFSLQTDENLPLLALVSRMDYQKGIDLALDGLRQAAGAPWQMILLGSGDPALESAAKQFEAEFPRRARVVIRYDAKLSRRMYGGADMLLMPSRYEPCGLAQMIGMRYGCLPVARATGGLRDTVKDKPSPENSTGFLFEKATANEMAQALRRAIVAYANRDEWEKRQLCAMQQDFSWARSAQAYVHIYNRLMS